MTSAKILGSVDFHPIDAVQLALPHSSMREPGTVDVLALDKIIVEAASMSG
jgi:hypothetical protein